MKAWISFLVCCSILSGCAPQTSREPTDTTTTAGSAVDGSSVVVATSTDSAPASTPDPAETASDSPAARVEPADQATAMEISFDDIQLPIQPDMVFRPFMLTDRVKELDGKRIRIHGYMLPDTKTKGITQFVMLKNMECKFGPGGQADHLINVLMNEGLTARFREDPISVEGVLKIKPFTGPDGNTWSLYDLACDRVERYRPRR
jgi:hypothetical protein